MPTLDRNGDVYILNLGDTENRFHPDWLERVNARLDEVESADGPRALVTTATGKFWSNGLDQEWMAEHGEEMAGYLISVHKLFARVLALPVPTVAAIGGHCFAAGGMLALAHDFRVMRADRGYFCLPEVDLRMPFTVPMTELVRARLSAQVAHEVMTTGRRYGGADALAAAIVDATAEPDSVLPTAIERASALSTKASGVLGTIKSRMYAPALAALLDPNAEGLTLETTR
jgi:enoyl-CoA hydratase/carnithine racemase